jgi:hypothetical protein
VRGEGRKVKLIDGPYAGVEVESNGSGAILMEGEFPDGSGRSEDGAMARYRPTRNRSEYRFKGWDDSVLKISLPGRAEAI